MVDINMENMEMKKDEKERDNESVFVDRERNLKSDIVIVEEGLDSVFVGVDGDSDYNLREENKTSDIVLVENKDKKRAYSKQYREDLKNGNRCRIYKVNPNTKKHRENIKKVRILDEKIKKLKGGLK
jgi:hypothetical protein